MVSRDGTRGAAIEQLSQRPSVRSRFAISILVLLGGCDAPEPESASQKPQATYSAEVIGQIEPLPAEDNSQKPPTTEITEGDDQLEPPAAEETTQKPPTTRLRFRLVNVTIPADSPLRNPSSGQSFDKPPDVYVILKRNGSPLNSLAGKSNGSTWHTGWSVDFEKDDDRNIWEILDGTNDRYSVEIWDYDRWSSDEPVLSVTGIRLEDLRGCVLEQGRKTFPKDRLVTIEFKAIDAE